MGNINQYGAETRVEDKQRKSRLLTVNISL